MTEFTDAASFHAFNAGIVDEFRAGLGESWDPQMEADWAEVLARWATVVRVRLDDNGI